MAKRSKVEERRHQRIGCAVLALSVLLILGLLIWIVRLLFFSSEVPKPDFTGKGGEIRRHAYVVDSLLSIERPITRLRNEQGEVIQHPVRGVGDLREAFGDLNDLQLATAEVLGIPALDTRADLEGLREQLVEVESIKHVALLQPMTHSVPYLIPRAARLLEHIAQSFNDSLAVKGFEPYDLVVTSVLRSEEDIRSLRKGNGNASANSCHRYATTFDLSWKRFRRPSTGEDINDERLKLILAEVLRDYRQLGACYVVYERRQACFHLTAR